jgi:predicted nucleotidyltransferase
VRKQSYGSVTVFWLDREAARKALAAAAERLGRERHEVRYVGLFGSLAQNRAAPGSDADLILLVDRSDQRFMDRPLTYLPYFDQLGIAVDLFCYTPEEAGRTPLAINALGQAICLWSRDEAIEAD